MRCPRCQGTLQPAQLEGIDVRICDSCTGTLVSQPLLVRLLEAIAVQLGDDTAPSEAIPDPGGHVPCPSCQRPMEAFGYMGTTQVTVNRCGVDELIWADPDELGAMARIYASTNKRSIERHRASMVDRERFAKAMPSLKTTSFVSLENQGAGRMNRFGEARRNTTIWNMLRALITGVD